MNLDTAIVYDIETFPNTFTLNAQALKGDWCATWEISDFRDDRTQLFEWFNYLNQTQTAMIGYNSVGFDYPVIHYIVQNAHCTVEDIYVFAMNIITSNDRFGNMVWPSDRFAPQIDLYKINHFDNPAKATSLKALQINMRSPSVVDMPVELGTVLNEQQVVQQLIPYNKHDVAETKAFTLFNMAALNFRVSLIEQFGVDVMNWPDTKIGSRMMEAKLGDELCFDRSTGRKVTRQTPRYNIPLKDIIFPYIRFNNPEFQRVLEYLNQQTLTTDEVKQLGKQLDKPQTIKTKGVFTTLRADVGGLTFHFGTGGIHGSILSSKVEAYGDHIIRDIDVRSLYPSIAIVNKLSPEHLGDIFCVIYAELPKERQKRQAEKGKKCVEANTLKLASNGVYGNSNNPYSVFYDPKFTITITINGQLMLCMLAEMLITVPTLKLIQINTDGITYYIDKRYEPQAAALCKEWERTTALDLEDADYSRMWIRDVNSYIAEDTDGDLKIKGAYWSPDAARYHASISEAQPPAWHKDLGNCVSVRAAVAAMVHGCDPEQFIRLTRNPYDFMCRIKTPKSSRLMHGGVQVQHNTRYYISTDGAPLVKESPPKGPPGAFKRAQKITEHEYDRVMQETGGQWDARVCTKNKSTYQTVQTNIQAGYKTSICNNVDDFDFNNIDYAWYINEARKLIIC